MGRITPVSRRLPAALAALVLVAGGMGEAHGLERVAAPAPAPHGGGEAWLASTQVTITYYNLCTGWTWIWDFEFRNHSSYGVQFDAPPGATTLAGHWEFTAYDVWTRGYTGILTVREVTEDDQLGAVLATQGYYPPAGWSWYPWEVPLPESGRVLVSARGPFVDFLRPGLVTEHTGTGPDGAGPACGTCYPPDRDTRSRYSLTSSIPWPGQRFNIGGVCDAELLWDAVFANAPTGVGDNVETRTWARLRAMFR